ncbi:MAG: hypothetical protein AB7I59_05450 [Geminicoccaceae bacterium]
MSRGTLRARLARLEQPQRNQVALRAELAALERQWSRLTPEMIEALTDEQLEDQLAALMARGDGGPHARMDAIRLALEGPRDRVARLKRDAERKAWVDGLTDAEVDAALAAMMAQPETVD